MRIAFGLPMHLDGVTPQPNNQAQVYAFLPIQSYGFRCASPCAIHPLVACQNFFTLEQEQ